jgi:hypothetical protein
MGECAARVCFWRLTDICVRCGERPRSGVKRTSMLNALTYAYKPERASRGISGYVASWPGVLYVVRLRAT